MLTNTIFSRLVVFVNLNPNIFDFAFSAGRLICDLLANKYPYRNTLRKFKSSLSRLCGVKRTYKSSFYIADNRPICHFHPHYVFCFVVYVAFRISGEPAVYGMPSITTEFSNFLHDSV